MKPLLSLLSSVLLLASPWVQAVEEGQPLPQCSLVFADNGQKVDWTAYRGKVVLVDFWATWCTPCQKSMPFLNGLRNEFKKDGFEVVAINVDEESEDARQLLKARPVDYPVAFDPQGQCPSLFGVKAMPSSYFVDKTGKVRHIHVGYREEDQVEIRRQLGVLLAE